MKKVLLVLIILFAVVSSALRADDFSKAMIKAKKNLTEADNKSDEKLYIKVRGEYERILQLNQDEWLVYYYMAYVDYNIGYTGMGSEKPDLEKLKKYNESAMEIINKAIDLNPEFSESYILKYGINFNRFIYESDKMMEIALASSSLQKQINAMDPDNPRFNYMQGMSMFYTPEGFGGGVKNAVEHFEKAYKVFETRVEKEEYYPSWGYDLTCGYLAICYKKLEDAEKSKMYYDKGLELNPESGFLLYYVKGELSK